MRCGDMFSRNEQGTLIPSMCEDGMGCLFQGMECGLASSGKWRVASQEGRRRECPVHARVQATCFSPLGRETVMRWQVWRWNGVSFAMHGMQTPAVLGGRWRSAKRGNLSWYACPRRQHAPSLVQARKSSHSGPAGSGGGCVGRLDVVWSRTQEDATR